MIILSKITPEPNTNEFNTANSSIGWLFIKSCIREYRSFLVEMTMALVLLAEMTRTKPVMDNINVFLEIRHARFRQSVAIGLKPTL